MKTVATTVGQAILLLVLGAAIGLGVNSVRGKDKIDPTRNYFPPAAPTSRSTLPPDNPADPNQATTAPAKSEFQEVTFDEAFKLFEDPKASDGQYVFVDARADGPFQAGHIPGALQCDYYREENYLPSVLDQVSNAEKVIVYCNGGECEDSLLVCREFMGLQVPKERIYLFRAGWQAWQAAGAPIEQSEK
jgi:3-mercaptopyruvate sulfurtransferase SseA